MPKSVKFSSLKLVKIYIHIHWYSSRTNVSCQGIVVIEKCVFPFLGWHCPFHWGGLHWRKAGHDCRTHSLQECRKCCQARESRHQGMLCFFGRRWVITFLWWGCLFVCLEHVFIIMRVCARAHVCVCVCVWVSVCVWVHLVCELQHLWSIMLCIVYSLTWELQRFFQT